MIKHFSFTCFLLMTIGVSICLGQQSYGGFPLGLTKDNQDYLKKSLKSNTNISLDKAALKDYINSIQGTPLFAIPLKAELNKLKNVQWQEIDGELVGWIKLSIADAKGIALKLSSFNLVPGARMFVYDIDGHKILGSFTSANEIPSGLFMTDVIKGQEIIIEIVLPIGSKRVLPFNIDHIYKVIDDSATETQSMEVDTGFMASLPCHQNINCTLGDNVQTEKRGVVRVMMVLEEGLGWCTGSLMNNTNEDRSPLVLSAFHCQDGYTPIWDLWRFDFEFETSSCDNPSAAPSYKAMQGCTYLAGAQPTDFILVKINEDIPSDYNAYYNGWDRRDDYEPRPTKFIHHPAGDIKKVAEDTDDLRVWLSGTNWNNDTTTPAGSHLRVELENGNHEPGSSGGPLFDDQGRIIGQLHGGNTNEECTLARAYFGRLSVSWDIGATSASRLAEWLDPAGTGATQLDGLGEQSNSSTMTLAGAVATNNGTPLSNVMMELTGDSEQTIMTDREGNYSFDNLPVNGNFVIGAYRNTSVSNGVSILDLTIMINHILGVNRITNDIQLRAGDVNGNRVISATDLIEVQNVILGLKDKFNVGNSWGFLPGHIQIENGQFDPSALNIIGYKKGDVNFSADPSK